MGQGGEGLRLRCTGRKEDSRRPVWRQKPADRLSLHVGSGVGGRLPEVLIPGRSFRRKLGASGASGRDANGGIAGAPAADRNFQETDGLAFSLGIVVWKQFQLRLSCLVYQGRTGDG